MVAGLVMEDDMSKSDIANLILSCSLTALVVAWHGIETAKLKDKSWKSEIHNAYMTGDSITVDGIDYRVIVMPEAEELQALRSSYARRCQAVAEKFFDDISGK